MADQNLQNTRNIGIIAHIDAGKTTTTERILYYTGRSYKIGEVHDGTATMDWMEQERERGITITAATTAEWRGHRVNITNTPGHVDFTVEVERLCACSMAASWSSTQSPGSSRSRRRSGGRPIASPCPASRSSTRWTGTSASFQGTLDQIKDRLGANPLPIQLPIGQESGFQGVIDVITQEALTFGVNANDPIVRGPVPADMADEVAKAREQLVERVIENDDELIDAVSSTVTRSPLRRSERRCARRPSI